MGKTKKKMPVAARFDPYRRNTTRITDLCDMLSAATANTIKEGAAMEDDAHEAHEDAAHAGSDGDDEGGAETRGKILQRHKREWKSLRSKLNDLKAHKKAMGHGTLAKKDAKKDVAKEIKAMEEAMRSVPSAPSNSRVSTVICCARAWSIGTTRILRLPLHPPMQMHLTCPWPRNAGCRYFLGPGFDTTKNW